MVSVVDTAKRALVHVMLQLATLYGLALTVARESSVGDVRAAFRKLARKVHPDKGGSLEHQQQLNAARDVWEDAMTNAAPRGRKRKSNDPDGQGRAASEQGILVANTHEAPRKGPTFRIRSIAVLFTYQKFFDVNAWYEFCRFVRHNVVKWGVKLWCATMETNTDTTYHIHLCVQFYKAAERSLPPFTFDGVRPNAEPNDSLGEGWCKSKLQDSVHRAMFYVWADKIGTARTAGGDQCVDGNCHPAWVAGALNKYVVSGRWLDKLLRAYKLSVDKYEEYMYLARDGVAYRKRNLDMIRARLNEEAEQREIAETIAEIRNDPDVYVPFKPVPEVQPWLDAFRKKALRYPVLLIHGASRSGKTEWAGSLFKNPLKLLVGSQTHFPDGMREFNRKVHDAVILDDVRDLEFLREHQEKLQGKYDVHVPFAPTAGGTRAYKRYLYKVPFVVTVNDSTRNLSFLASDDFCKKTENVFFLSFCSRPGEVAPKTAWPVS